VALLATGLLMATAHAQECTAPVARVVSVEGAVEVKRSRGDTWAPAFSDVSLCAGDALRVGARGRAALRLPNQTLLRVDQNSILSFAPADGPPDFIDLLRGAVEVLTRTPKPFRVRTPFLNAGVEGTEFVVRVGEQSAQVLVLEGRVTAGNEQGQVMLVGGEGVQAQRGQLPRRDVVVSPADAVQWALHYPSIAISAPSESDPVLIDADSLSARGRTREALARLEAVAAEARTPRQWVRLAGLLLQVGSVDEARAALDASQRLAGPASDTLALQSIIATVRNEGDTALRLARQAAELEPGSPAAHLALSYALQARFDIGAAAAEAQAAATLAPGSAIAWARLAELRLAQGAHAAAVAAAARAAALAPELSRAHSALGFAQLARLNAAGAREEFTRAITLDPSDPLPQLGLGLALIRSGRLAAGREAIEAAAILQPLDALVRSYLGKAYFDEGRGGLADRQFTLARALDPNDPTPRLYQGIARGTGNRPVEAVDELLQSIELNDRRAVYRSRLLLDDDLAARSTSLARLFMELDLPEAALAQAAASLAVDPSSASAHRFLSDAASVDSRHQITRASELLQAQLRQPLSVTPLQAQLSNDRLFSLRTEGPQAGGLNEFGSMFVRNGLALQLHGVAGSQGTVGEQVIVSGVRDNLGFGASALRYRTDGVRPNSDARESEVSGMVQAALTPDTTVQLEAARHVTHSGDTVGRFDPEAYSADERDDTARTDVRLGLRHAFGPASEVLVALTHRSNRGSFDLGGGFVIRVTDTATRSELQYVRRGERYWIVSGLGVLQGTTREDVLGDVVESSPHHANAYAYGSYALVRNRLFLIGGLSYDRMRSRDAGGQHEVNPKLGLLWHPAPETTLRIAAYRVLKRRLNPEAGLEPTQVAGFDQFFDDPNGAIARGVAMAADSRVGDTRFGVSASSRRLRLPSTNTDLSIGFDPSSERAAQGYVQRTLAPRWVASARLRYSRYQRPAGAIGSEGFTMAETTELPVALKYFDPLGWWASIGATGVRQHGSFIDASFQLTPGSSRFSVVDAGLGYRLPRHRGMASLSCSNLLGRSFRFQDIGLEAPRYLPERGCRARLSLDL
jgi:Flp pilus assembly protein TadD